MKIGIDCRLYGAKHTGIGRYAQNLVENLLEIDKENKYVLFFRDDRQYQSPPERVKIAIADIPHYSMKEQLFFSNIVSKENVDLMHFPHFNVPVFYKGNYVVTIHDLIKHVSRGKETTTKSAYVYWLKYLGYQYVFKHTVSHAGKIITPSNFVKEEIIREYGVRRDKIIVTYEGVDEKLKSSTPVSGGLIKDTLDGLGIKKPYLLYVGSIYPHKNIDNLIKAVKTVNNIQLVVVCGRDVFLKRLEEKIKALNAENLVKFVGFLQDSDLATLYRQAEAFVFPTLSEGFGLPGLEAMSLGCPVLCSNIAVLKEIYHDNAVYFDPLNPSEIAGKIRSFLTDKKLQSDLKKRGPEFAKTYSWKKMAKETLGVYRSF